MAGRQDGEIAIAHDPASAVGPSPAPSQADRTTTLSRPAARTRLLLLRTASSLIRKHGHVPPISEVAELAGVSRATAYRYFPSRSKLIAAVVDHSLSPVRAFDSKHRDAESRLRELFETTFRSFREYEPQMRSALQLSLEHGALDAAGRLTEERYVRGHRVAILRRTFEPLLETLPAAIVDRLCKAMSIVYGIEPYVVLRDIWGCDTDEIGEIALWMAGALLRQAQVDGAGAPRRSRARAPTRAQPRGEGRGDGRDGARARARSAHAVRKARRGSDTA